MTTPGAQKGKKARRWLRRAAWLALLAGAVVWFTRPSWYGVEVRTVRAERGPIVETLVTTARADVPARHAVAPQLAGRLVSIDARAGDRVEAGQVLARLDDTDARAALARAEAILAGIAAARADLGARRRPATREALRQARANLAQAERDHTRDRELAASGALTRTELERSELALTLAKSRLRAASAEANANLDGGPGDLTLDAQQAEAEAALKSAEAHLARHTLTAPAAGVVLERGAEPGGIAIIGSPIFSIAAGPVDRLIAEPDEKALSRLALGQRAVASADAFPDRAFDAEVAWIAPAIDPRRGTVEIHLSIAAPPEHLRPDMTASAEIALNRKDSALTVPRALVQDLATDAPWVLVARDGRAAKQPVETGLLGPERVEILSGLAETDALIAPSPALPAVGAKVRPVVEAATDAPPADGG
jgi:HlyD family secretion protein